MRGQGYNVYVSVEHAPVWARAQKHAKAKKITMSRLLLNALAEYLDRHEKPPRQ